MILNLKSKLVCLFAIVLFQAGILYSAQAQITDIQSLPKSLLIQDTESLAKQNTSTNELIKFIKSYNKYPKLEKYRGQHIFFIRDSIFGDIPFKLFLPQNYNPSKPSTLILSLHGAVGMSKFENAANSSDQIDKDDDPFYSSLCKQNFIVIKPFADPAKGFNWAANKFGSDVNYTFNALSHLIKVIKQVVNVDDNKVFVYGHSDGSDGAFGFSVYQPSMFAGFVLYNSMFNILFTNNIFLKNVINRPLYEAHSDKDDLRPVEQNRVIINLLDSLGTNITYKEYKGYTHEDKHLQTDFTNSLKFIDSTTRNPYRHNIYWETNGCFK
ncbi:hypothetical protein [Mucilaginibacter sp. KACC 22063]|uniref:hypothetical protein n=1 Tax=Mucilaginibacter sp. KACC 22063 TaxID=3025666 RepID=UPI0023655142|nr:hypothetical protein [Mucilaginibacter sp. KACC 22063]WDF53357.1 hypothetical protein PQ461_10405 [Mucilaginibacter sp. KACC 22063]